MKLSVHDVLKGGIVGIDLGGGAAVTVSIAMTAAGELALSVGDEAFAVIKASGFVVGKP